MAASGRITIEDETGVVQLGGTATFPDGLGITQVEDADGNVLIEGAPVDPNDPLSITTPVTAGGSRGIQIETGGAPATGDSSTGAVQIRTGDVADGAGNGDGGDITLAGGDGDLGGGEGGSVIIQAGGGDTPGSVSLRNQNGDNLLVASDATLSMGATGGGNGFFGSNGTTQQTITGALSAVVDPAALDVLTSIVAALEAYNLVIDGTT